MTSDLLYVLDLGTTKAVCLGAEHDLGGNLQVRVAATAPAKGLRKGRIEDPDMAAVTIDELVRKTEHLGGREIRDLVVGLGGTHVQSASSQGFVPVFPPGRAINREDVLHVINHSRQIPVGADREQIHALPREFRIDGRRGIKEPIGTPAAKLEVLTCILSAQTAEISVFERALHLAGRRATQIVPSVVASALGVTTKEERERGIAVVDLGGGTTSIAVFVGGALAYVGAIPIGGQTVTNDVRLLLKTSDEESERLKHQHGAALAIAADEGETVEVLQADQERPRPMERRVLCEIIESRMRELAGLIAAKLDDFGGSRELDAGIAVTGGGSLLAGIGTLFANSLPRTAITVRAPQVGGAYGSIVSRPGMATAVGLARFGLESVEDELVSAGGGEGWRDRVRSFWSLFGGKS